MKPLLLIILSILVFHINATGQFYFFKSNPLKIDTTLSNRGKIDHPDIRLNNDLKDRFNSNSTSELNTNQFRFASKIPQKFTDPRDQIFPGASRYYAKRPNLIAPLYLEHFAIKPDSSVKYYLIIKDTFDKLTLK